MRRTAGDNAVFMGAKDVFPRHSVGNAKNSGKARKNPAPTVFHGFLTEGTSGELGAGSDGERETKSGKAEGRIRKGLHRGHLRCRADKLAG